MKSAAGLALALAGAMLVPAGCKGRPGPQGGGPPPGASPAPLRVVVMDRLADQLACDCVKGYAQRRYPKLCEFLSRRLGRAVEHVHTEDLTGAVDLAGGQVDLIVGQWSTVEHDAAETATPVRPIAMLTDASGGTDLTGVFLVRQGDPAASLADLRGRTVVLGPADRPEKHAAALAALREAGAPAEGPHRIAPDCAAAAISVVRKEADAAVVSSYYMPLLEGCGAVASGELRAVGRTSPLPFVTVFATAHVSPAEEEAVVACLAAVREDGQLLTDLESKDGFVPVPPAAAKAIEALGGRPLVGWTDWRGPRRDGTSRYVPKRLPERPSFLWRQALTGNGLSGVAATSRFVVVADKDPLARTDIWRCLDANSGRELWRKEYPAEKELDYTNSPRATPVIRQGLVYVLGALGDLHCIGLASGREVWGANLPRDFGAELPQWGACSTPLIAEDALIVNPGGREASVVALDPWSGKVLWKSPGEPAAYASFVAGDLGGGRQVVGYDAASLGGWDLRTGRRIWRLVPEEEGDFNVPTPVLLGRRLLVATENNGARLYEFDGQGAIRPSPPGRNAELAPDTSTPVAEGDFVVGCWKKLLCLDANAGLRLLGQVEDKAFEEHVSLIAGEGRVLVTSVSGEVLLLSFGLEGFRWISRLRPFDYMADAWPHPALVGSRLYIRTQKEVCCLLLE